MTRNPALLSLLVTALSLAGCDKDALNLVQRVDNGVAVNELGQPIVEAGPRETGGDALGDGLKKDTLCAPTGSEACDGLDNDCNGKIDDVDPLTLQTDAKNCGACGKACSVPNAFSSCKAGACVMGDCAPGHWDLNKDSKDGCEYSCLKSNNGSEACPAGQPDCACDKADNDCDGTVDEGFDLSKDVNNCGACGKRCLFTHGQPQCVAGACVLAACEAKYADVNKDPKDGCEYSCPIWPPATSDPCDNLDNDCDGNLDEDFAPQSCGKTGGACQAGKTACQGGNVACVGAVGPKPEVCNSTDDDCDGIVDNGFDKQNDPRYCGSCTACVVPHAIAKCTAGACGIAVCELGWVDLDKQLGNGCEYACVKTGVEICDGLDNDCNGKVDTADVGMVPLGGNPCLQLGACAGAKATCSGSAGWLCGYGAKVQLKSCTSTVDCGGSACVAGLCAAVVAPEESLCDGADNDCDGLTDETFPNKGQPCAESGKKGICQGTGAWACNSGGSATVCTITAAGQSPQNELCNGKDDDCDGLTDEEADDAAGQGVKDAMVHVIRGGKSFWIYSYEASRPDAGGQSAGSSITRSCSRSGVLPWANVTFAQAGAACAASGKRLCTKDEWLLACQGPSATVYPYGSSYQGTTCNGLENAAGKPLAAGSKPGCVSSDGIADMSGNLKEWTNDPRSDGAPPDPDGYTVRGGAYDNTATGLRCDFTFAVMPPTYYFPNLGFRCCSDTAP